MFKGFTNRCKKIINYYTLFEAERYSHTVIQPEHILIAILKEGQSNAYTVMSEVIDLTHFQYILESHVGKMKDDEIAQNTGVFLYYNMEVDVLISERTKNVFQLAIDEASKIGAMQIDTFSLFLACCEEDNSISRAIIMRHEVMLEDLRNHYYQYIKAQDNKQHNNEKQNTVIDGPSSPPNDAHLPEIKNIRFKKFIQNLDIPFSKPLDNVSPKQAPNTKQGIDKNAQKTLSKTNAQEKGTPSSAQTSEYLQDLTTMAKEGKFTSIFGRDSELNQMYRVLLRKQKNNPVLVGDPGVGKTAIVEELALRLVEGRVPLPLLNAHIFQLDLAALTAGTRFRGDFEERLLGVIEEIRAKKTKEQLSILFIDEFHHIIGSGLANGLSMDGAGILKPALARGDVSCIGITTVEEFRKNIESDKAFTRRLQRIEISEMSDEDTFLTLQKIKPHYEEIHNVVYNDEALREIIRLARNYIFDRHFPDKAVDLLDEIGAHTKILNFGTPQELSALYVEEQQISKDVLHIAGKIAGTIDPELTNSHIKKTDELKSVIERKNKLHTSLLNNVKQNVTTIYPEQVRDIIALITGIPSDRFDMSKTKSIKVLKEGLQSNIVGQEQAIGSLVSTIKRSSVGLHRGNRPIGSFMFMGPTGVGKTYTAKQLAKYLFGSEESLSRFDMSDFAESNSVNRLVGAPPGYVGYEESGLLVKMLRRNPRQILLFDEIEKAHGRVFDLFLQILEEGILQGQMGEEADFRHSIIVMTSNIGSQELLAKQNFGFGDASFSHDYIKHIIHDELAKQFRPEFINRFDEIITFNPLGDNEINKIIDLMAQELSETLLEQNITLQFHQKAKTLLYEQYFDIQFGARSIRRGIREIENNIAEAIIDKEISMGDGIDVRAKDNRFDIVVQPKRDIEVGLSVPEDVLESHA